VDLVGPSASAPAVPTTSFAAVTPEPGGVENINTMGPPDQGRLRHDAPCHSGEPRRPPSGSNAMIAMGEESGTEREVTLEPGQGDTAPIESELPETGNGVARGDRGR